MGSVSRAARRAASLPGSAAWEVHWEAIRRSAAGDPVTILSIGEPDAETVPGVNEAGISAIREGLGRRYSHGGGALDLKAAIAERYQKLHGVKVDPRRVFVSSGAQNALFQTLRCVLDEDTKVIVPDPCYVTYEGTVVSNGGSVDSVSLRPEEGFRLDVDDVAKLIQGNTRAVLVNTPNNPTGATISEEDMKALADLCRSKGIWLMADEVYSDYLFGGRKHVSAAAVRGAEDNCITINAVSKSFSMVGWRIGWAIVPEVLIDPMQAVTEGMLFGVSPISEAAALKALEVGNDSDALGKEYESRFRAISDHLSGIPGVETRPAGGGLFVLADVRGTGLTAEQFAKKLLDDYQVSVLPADAFGAAGTGHIRISLTKNVEILKMAAEKIAACAHDAMKLTGADHRTSVVGRDEKFGSVLFCREGLDPTQDTWGDNVLAAIRKHSPGVEVKEWPVKDVEDISAAVVWKPPPGLLAKMPKLKLVQVLGAGVDGVLDSLSDFGSDVNVCRLVDPVAVQRMQSYVLAAAMDHVQHSAYVTDCQKHVEWDSSVGPENISSTTVGIMGLGEMGRAAGYLLSKAGFNVVGWSRSRRVPDTELAGFHKRYVGGREALIEMAKTTDVLVCMLPLTPSTNEIIDKDLLSNLPAGATVVNCGRGEHVKVDDLLEVLDTDALRCAVLDVFNEEPLPKDSPLWKHPKAIITPHLAGAAGEASAGEVIADNINRVAKGDTPRFIVNLSGGY